MPRQNTTNWVASNDNLFFHLWSGRPQVQDLTVGRATCHPKGPPKNPVLPSLNFQVVTDNPWPPWFALHRPHLCLCHRMFFSLSLCPDDLFFIQMPVFGLWAAAHLIWPHLKMTPAIVLFTNRVSFARAEGLGSTVSFWGTQCNP